MLESRRWTVAVAVSGMLAGFAAAPGGAVAQTQPTKVRIAIAGFENNSTFHWWGDNLGYAAADELATQLVKTGKFTVIERQQLDAILAEQNLGQSGAVTAATAAKVGELLGAQILLMGSITQFSIDNKSGGFGPVRASYSEAESILDARLVATTTGEILLVAEGDGKKRFGGAQVSGVNYQQHFDAGVAQEALRPAVEKVVEGIVAQADDLASLKPPAGTANIVGGSDDSVYLDRGENFGIQLGQRFTVHRVVEEIKDAQGKVLDRLTEQVGVIEVSRVLSQSSVCAIVEGEAREGDTVTAETP